MNKSGNSIQTQRELASKLQRHESQVSRWLRRSDWPCKRRPDWTNKDLVMIRAWMKSLASAELDESLGEGLNSLGLTALQKAKLMVYLERAATLKLDRLILEGEYLKRADVDRDTILKIRAVSCGLAQIPRRLAARIALVNEELEVERILDEEVRTITNAFAGVKT